MWWDEVKFGDRKERKTGKKSGFSIQVIEVTQNNLLLILWSDSANGVTCLSHLSPSSSLFPQCNNGTSSL